MDPLETRYRQTSDLAARTIGGEAVVVTPADSLVHELDEVATFVFERCDGSRTAAQLVDEVLAAFAAAPAQVRDDVAGLLATLVARRLVEPVPG